VDKRINELKNTEKLYNNAVSALRIQLKKNQNDTSDILKLMAEVSQLNQAANEELQKKSVNLVNGLLSAIRTVQVYIHLTITDKRESM
jgi:hypothetical protein